MRLYILILYSMKYTFYRVKQLFKSIIFDSKFLSHCDKFGNNTFFSRSSMSSLPSPYDDIRCNLFLYATNYHVDLQKEGNDIFSGGFCSSILLPVFKYYIGSTTTTRTVTTMEGAEQQGRCYMFCVYIYIYFKQCSVGSKVHFRWFACGVLVAFNILIM